MFLVRRFSFVGSPTQKSCHVGACRTMTMCGRTAKGIDIGTRIEKVWKSIIFQATAQVEIEGIVVSSRTIPDWKRLQVHKIQVHGSTGKPPFIVVVIVLASTATVALVVVAVVIRSINSCLGHASSWFGGTWMPLPAGWLASRIGERGSNRSMDLGIKQVFGRYFGHI